ncbi:MAG: hypothetical protein ACRDRA_22100 [Pseudonocardiaceae bacterium]
MPSQSDASIKLLYAVDQGTFFTIDDVALNDPFDCIMNVEVGATLRATVNDSVLRVAIRNLTQSNTLQTVTVTRIIPPDSVPFLAQERLNFNAPAVGGAVAGDVLQAVASYKVRAGILTDFSTAESNTFVVSD